MRKKRKDLSPESRRDWRLVWYVDWDWDACGVLGVEGVERNVRSSCVAVDMLLVDSYANDK